MTENQTGTFLSQLGRMSCVAVEPGRIGTVPSKWEAPAAGWKEETTEQLGTHSWD